MRTVLIEVEEHEAIPDGCFIRYSALGPTRTVSRIRAESPEGIEGVCVVEGRDAEDQPVPAWAVHVDDSSAGQAWLVGGGAHGVRVRPEAGGGFWAEAYLLLSEDSIVA